MYIEQNITALRMERQHLSRKASKTEYDDFFRDMEPGMNVYFGNPPSLIYRVDFNDIDYNRERQRTRAILKGRFIGGTLGWIVPDDLELFAAAFIKHLNKPDPRQLTLLELIEREGPLTIQQMKEETGMLVKEITPILHRFQEAFLIYEDQNIDGEWDRGWYKLSDMFPEVNLQKYTRNDALKILLQRFAFRLVVFDFNMAKSYYKLPDKDIKAAITSLINDGILTENEYGYILHADLELLKTYSAEPMKSVYCMHLNDILVKSNEHWLKERFIHSYHNTLYYMLIDGELRGAVVGRARYTPEVEDVILDLPQEQVAARKNETLKAIHVLCGIHNPIKRYQGEEI